MVFDLHIHTKKSDGILWPEEIINLFTHPGDVIGLVEHNQFGLSDIVKQRAEEKRVRLVHGPEVSSHMPELKKKIHIVGYGIASLTEELENYFRQYSKGKNEQTKNRCHLSTRNPLKLKSGQTISISFEELQDFLPGKETYFWNDMIISLRNKYNCAKRDSDPAMSIEESGELLTGKSKDTFQKFQCCYYNLSVPLWPTPTHLTYKSTNQVIRLIRKSGGIACLVHPGQQQLKLEEIRGINPDAIEVYSPKNNGGELNIKYYAQVAQELRLLVSGGTDAHLIAGYNNLGKIIKLSRNGSLESSYLIKEPDLSILPFLI